MSKTAERIDNIQEEISKADTIYDILIVLYKELDTSDSPQYIRNYIESKTVESVCMTEDYIKTGQLIDELLNLGISFEVFKSNLKVILGQSENCKNICIDILILFDQILAERENYPFLKQNNKMGLNKLYLKGPLNQERLKYGLYLMPEKGIADMSPVFKNNRIQRFVDESKVNSLLRNYTIVRNRDGEPETFIKGYNNSGFEQWVLRENSMIKIAVIPFYNSKWYKEHYECYKGRNYFAIEEDAAFTDEINRAYIHILEEMNWQGVDIVVFPELAMAGSTKQTIRNWLAEQCFRNGDFNIRLVFMGSHWNYNERSNCCTLLSATGIPLIENHKKIGFNLKEDGIKYYEDLRQRPEKLELIDVKGLGRILYFICRDALEEVDQAFLQSEYFVNVEIISCYSSSLSYFESAMKRFAQTHNGISVVAHCCEARKKTKKTGFVSFPATNVNSGNNIVEGLIYYYDNKHSCEECRIGKCQCIYTLYPMEMSEYNGFKTIRINKDWNY